MSARILTAAVGCALAGLLASCVTTSEGPKSHDDVTFEVYSASWTNSVDNDDDGYTPYRRLSFDVDASDVGSYDLYAKVWYRTSPSGTWYLYYTTELFTITGSAVDPCWVAVGSPNDELSNGTYDFWVEVYDYYEDTLVAEATPSGDADLNAEDFEYSNEDVVSATYTVYSATWSNRVDTDTDTFTAARRITFDVDVSGGLTRSVYVKLWYKLATSGTYSLYTTTGTYTIVGSASDDAYWVDVGSPYLELPNGAYDFQIEVFEAGGVTPVATLAPATASSLDNQGFETSSQDQVLTYSVASAYWTDTVDADGDGYTAYRRLTFDPDVSSGTHSVYAAIYYRTSGAGAWTLYYTTATFSITGLDVDAYWVAVGLPNPELSYGSYDFEIRLYEQGGVTPVDTRGPTDDADLSAKLFEVSGPSTVYYTLVNGTWADMQVSFGGIVVDTIPYQDSIVYQDSAAATGSYIARLESIVLTDNSVFWLDTLTRGATARNRYYVSDQWFQFWVTNNTNRNMGSAVVDGYNYDSSAAYLTMYDDADVGFYRSSAYTDLRLYFVSATQYVYWLNQNTVSSTSEAMLYHVTPNNILSKAQAGASTAPKVVPPRPLRVYNFGTYLQQKGIQ